MNEQGMSPNGLMTRNAETGMEGEARPAEGRGRATILRTPEMIAGEINVIKDQVRSTAILASVEIGRRLQEAKALVPAGEWGTWLQSNVDYSQRTAQNLMALCTEYEASPQPFRELSYTKAVMLLSVPREEREEFAETHDVEGMSSRELQKQIAQLKQKNDEMQLTMEELIRKAQESPAEEMQQRISDLQGELSRQKEAVSQAKEVNKQAKADAKALREQLTDAKKQMQEQAEAAQTEKAALEQALRDKEQPIIQQVTPPDVEQELSRLRAQVSRTADEQALRAGWELLRHSLARLKEQLSALSQRDEQLAHQFSAAFAQGLRQAADGLGGGAA